MTRRSASEVAPHLRDRIQLATGREPMRNKLILAVPAVAAIALVSTGTVFAAPPLSTPLEQLVNDRGTALVVFTLALLVPLGLLLMAVGATKPDRAGDLAAIGIVTFVSGALAYLLVGFGVQFGGLGLVIPADWATLWVREWSPFDLSLGPGWGVVGLRYHPAVVEAAAGRSLWVGLPARRRCRHGRDAARPGLGRAQATTGGFSACPGCCRVVLPAGRKLAVGWRLARQHGQHAGAGPRLHRSGGRRPRTHLGWSDRVGSPPRAWPERAASAGSRTYHRPTRSFPPLPLARWHPGLHRLAGLAAGAPAAGPRNAGQLAGDEPAAGCSGRRDDGRAVYRLRHRQTRPDACIARHGGGTGRRKRTGRFRSPVGRAPHWCGGRPADLSGRLRARAVAALA